MNFAAKEFFLMVLGTVSLYYLCPKRFRWVMLLLSSCVFYAYYAGAAAFAVACATALFAWLAAIRIENCGADRKKRRLIQSAAAAVLAGFLALTKLQKSDVFDLRWLIVPLGVSYYTFSIIGYLVDVTAKKQSAERNPLKLLLYTLYFPKIVQGPISKFREIGPRLTRGESADYQSFCFGAQRILWGFFKKLVIVERSALLTCHVFDGDLTNYSAGGAVLLFTTFIAAVSHYCDFSGYMDIVIGVSQMMGIELEENFRQPFLSRTAAEFWRRWHMTLGTWFKDYVYMPLVIHPTVIRIGKWFRERMGKRAGKTVMAVIPLAVVWLLTGLWHGGGNYLVWGFYWGFILILSTVLAPELKKASELVHIRTESRPWICFQTARTFCLFVGGVLISTLVGYRQLGLYFRLLFKSFAPGRLTAGTLRSLGLSVYDLATLLAAIALLFAVDLLGSKRSVRERIAHRSGPVRWVLYALLILGLVFFGVYGPGYTTSGFAYARF